MAAAGPGRGRLRTSRADRDQVIAVLKAAFVQGRLNKDEFEARIDRALTSRTYAELAEVTADVPAELTDTQRVPDSKPPRRPARRRIRISMNTAVTAGGFVAIATNIAMVGALIVGNGVAVIAIVTFFVIAAAAAIGAMIVAR
jgi:type IV secretory pathway VirB6-like protein